MRREGASADGNPLLFFSSAYSHSFIAFSSDMLGGITHGGLLQEKRKEKKLWAMVCLATPLHNGSGAGMLLMPSGDIGKNRNLIEERTRREMTGDFLACCSPLRKSSGTS